MHFQRKQSLNTLNTAVDAAKAQRLFTAAAERSNSSSSSMQHRSSGGGLAAGAAS